MQAPQITTIDDMLYINKSMAVDAGVSLGTIKMAVKESWNGWQFTKIKGIHASYIAYEPLPEKYKKPIRQKIAGLMKCTCEDRSICAHGDPYTYYRNTSLVANLENDYKATDFFNTFRIFSSKGDTGLSKEYQQKYVTDAKILNLLIKYRDGSKAYRNSFGQSRSEFAESVCSLIKSLKAEGKSDLPTSYRNLMESLRKYEAEGYESLVTGRFGNQNSNKLFDIHIKTLLGLIQDKTGRKFSYYQIYQQFLMIAHKQGWKEVLEPKPITFEAIGKKLVALENQWFLEVHGPKAFMNNKEFVINRDRASEPNLEWQIDGTPEALWYYDPEKREINKLYVMKVMDSHSRKIVGYSIGYTETSHLVFESIKMGCMVNHVLPLSIRYDKGSALTATESQNLFNQMGCLHFPTKTGQARAKSIEPWQRHMNDAIYSWYENKSGANIEATTLRSKPNEEYLKKNAKHFPLKEEVVAQIHMAFSLWDNMPGRDGLRPVDKYADAQPRKRAFTPENLIQMFYIWRKDGKKLQAYPYTQEGITITVKKQEYKYIPCGLAMEVAKFHNKHCGQSWFYVKYDPTEMSMIALYRLPDGYELKEENLRLECYVTLKKFTKESALDMTDGDGQNLAYQREIQRLQTILIKKETEAVHRELEAQNILTGAIQLKDVHKDTWNNAKIDIQRKQAMGYIGTSALSDINKLFSDTPDDIKEDQYDYPIEVPVNTKPFSSIERDMYDD